MDQLEQYLDQVCRGIAGPRSLRQHIRQELREHLRDAAAEHQAAGLTVEEALARALEDFGGPELVRAELQATHGHRLLTVVVDKALQWKEKTMKAKWIWSTVVHVALALLMLAEIVFVYSALYFILPKFKQYVAEGWIDPADPAGAGPINAWSISVLGHAAAVAEYGWWIVLAVAVVWGLFEWRVRSENKTYMRLAGLATAALALMVPVVLTAAALILPLIVLGPSNAHTLVGQQIARRETSRLDESLKALDQVLAAKDWPEITDQTRAASRALQRLYATGVGQPLPWQRFEDSDAGRLKAAVRALPELEEAVRQQDQTRLDGALKTFRERYESVRNNAAPG